MSHKQLRRKSWKHIVDRRNGFTLVEVLIVVTIVALLASVIVPTLSSTSGAVALEAMARTLAADIRMARQSAVQYNTSFAVTFDLTNNSYQVSQVSSGSSPTLTNLLSPGASGNIVDLDEFGASRIKQSHVVLGGAALKVSRASVTDITLNSTGGTGPGRTQDTVIWLSAGQGQDRLCILISVSWITGAVSVGDVQSYAPTLTQPVF